MAVLPAILEEYAFRHVIFSFLLPYGKWGAVICSALLFGISHIEPHKIITATVFGVFLAVFRAHTGSLVFPIIIHFINNLISVLTLLFPENIALNSSLNVIMYLFITSAFILLFYILFIGISKKHIPLSLRQHIGYSLPLHKFIFKFVFNVGFIPFLIIYSFYIYLSLRL